MKITHADLFNRAAESYDFAAIWTIEDACGRDLDEAMSEYEAAKPTPKTRLPNTKKIGRKLQSLKQK